MTAQVKRSSLLGGHKWLWLSLVSLNLVLGWAALILPTAPGLPSMENIQLLQAFSEALFPSADWRLTPLAALEQQILMELKLPRAILALRVGCSLGLVGASLQGLLHNPLAEPGILGISSAGALGATLTFYSGLAATLPMAVPLGGIAGAAIATLGLFLLAGRQAHTATLILAGIAINALAGGLTSLVLNLSPNPFAAMEIIFWQMGSLADRSMSHVWLSLPLMLLGWVSVGAAARSLRALALGEFTARSLGISMPMVRLQIIGGAALAVGAAVAVTGVIGFVGLIVPHVLRSVVKQDPAVLLPASALGGAALVTAADLAVRLLPLQVELKIGVLTALIGAPFFFYLIARQRNTADAN